MKPDPFGTIVAGLVGRRDDGRRLPVVDPIRWLDGGPVSDGGPVPDGASAAALSVAFLVQLAEPGAESGALDVLVLERARSLLADPPPDTPEDLVALYRDGLSAVRAEIDVRAAADPGYRDVLEAAAARLAQPHADDDARTSAIWSVLFPEAVGLADDVDAAVDALRERRIVHIDEPAGQPLGDPMREVLFTSNVLLGLPLATEGSPMSDAGLDPEIAAAVRRARAEPQAHWFDHPIPIGIEPERSELLRGLQGLDEAMDVELRRRSGADRPDGGRLTCVLSVSVTHPALRDIARRYVEVELDRGAPLRHLDIVVISETDARRLVDDVLRPAADRFLGPDDDPLDVVGVDGEYGRHYTFLKAIAAAWHVLVDPAVRATFKIDLDQAFPQAELIGQTGSSALEHLTTQAWGARGRDAAGQQVELGMIAGALVNERDIDAGLFTPDVPVPDRPPRWDEHAFYSVLPQAVSTRAEMLERHDGPVPDGTTTVLERIHVTGGTNGILVDALRRHRPFTPTFVGRAEDQAYVLSAYGSSGPRLAYLHAPGLRMRHDKEAYAREAIEAARIGKLVGDHVRILVFSAYARALVSDPDGSGLADVEAIKAIVDPFTGGFISHTPVTVVLLRFALKLVSLVDAGDHEGAREFADLGARRLREALAWTGDADGFRAAVARERRSWGRFYDTLDRLEVALRTGDPAAVALRDRARSIVDDCRVRPLESGHTAR